MSGPKIAIFSNSSNAQAKAVARAVERQGGEALAMDIRLGGDGHPLMSMGEDGLFWEGVDFSQVCAVHVVCKAFNTPVCAPPVLNDASFARLRADYFAEKEFQAASTSFFQFFAARGGLVINPVSGVYIDHDSKTGFYEKLRAWGFIVPCSLTTNDSAQALAFIRTHGEAVAKPAIGIGSTRLICEKDLELIDDVRLCPVLLQERIKGQTLRVHVVGDTVVCTVRVMGTGLDSRTGKREVAPVALSEEQSEEIVRANRMLGLHYSAWDAIQEPGGRLVLLDCNPGPHILWIGLDLADKILEQLAIYMTTYGSTACLKTAASAVSPVDFS